MNYMIGVNLGSTLSDKYNFCKHCKNLEQVALTTKYYAVDLLLPHILKNKPYKLFVKYIVDK